MPKDVFISYAQNDKNWADLVCAQLEEAGISCWIAPRDIAPGVTWPAAITDAIANCRAMIIVFSTHANQSPHMAREVEGADRRRVPILPVRVENIAPAGDLEYFLGNRQWFDLHDRTLERRTTGLPEAIAGLLGESAPPVAPPKPAPPVRQSPRWWIAALASVVAIAGVSFYAWPRRAPADPAPSAPASAAPTAEVPAAASRPAAPVTERPKSSPSVAPAVAAKIAEPPPAKPKETLPGFAGNWQAVVKYSWGISQTERFNLKVDKDEVYGTASYVGGARGIRDGKIDGRKISFNTRSTTMLGDKTYEEKHYYEGRLSAEGIEFVLQTDSGYDSRPPEEFTAKRLD